MVQALSHRNVKDSHPHEEGREEAEDQSDQAEQSEIPDHGDGGCEQRDKANGGYDQGDDHRLGDVFDRFYHRLLRLDGAGEFLIYPVLELDGIVDAYADQYWKCGHRHHGEWYMQEAHGTEGPANSQEDDWDGEERPLHLVEGDQQCHYHQKSCQEKNGAVALGHLCSY